MHITINSQRLAAELRLLCKVAPTKPAIQILGYILLEAEEGKVTLYATDLEIGLACTCEADVSEPGRVALPAANFLAMVEQFEDGDVELAAGPGQSYVAMRCGAFKSRLQVLASDDFPDAPAAEGKSSTLDAAAFRRLIERTRYAINAGSSKTFLQGALLTLSGEAAAMAATDGKRLALATATNGGSDARVIIPAKTLDVLSLQAEAGEIELIVGARHLFFRMDHRLLVSRAFEDKFPKYEQSIPHANDRVVTVGRNALAAALRRVRLVSPETKAIYFALEPNALHLSSSSAEVGSADEVVPVAYEGPSFRICASGAYVLDFLEAAGGQSVTIMLKEPSSAGQQKNAMLLMDGPDHLGVIMLMKA